MSDDTGELLEAPLVIEYAFNRTTGPVIGAFLTGLTDQRVLGIRDTDGRVVCPPVEYDPETGEPLTEMVEVGTEGEVTSWSWVANVRQDQPLDHPARARASSASTAPTPSMLHVVDAPGPEAMSTGARVRIRWADEPEGLITDIACFELTGGAA